MNTIDLNQSLAELTIDVCNVESVSGNEKNIADLVENSLQLPHLEITRDGNAVIAKTNLNREKRIILAGHLDTVPVSENLPAKLMHFEREQVVWGRGSVDMKGGIAVFLKLAAELTEPKYDLTWIFYDQEEVESEKNGLGRVASNHPQLLEGDFAILGEPSSARIEGGCNGTLRIEISTKGQKAHSARPWMGSNAIHSMSEVLTRLTEYQPSEIEVEGLLYKESLNAVGISGGVANNVIPDWSTVTVNYRFAPDKTAAEAIAFLEQYFEGFSFIVTDQAAAARPGLELSEVQEFIEVLGVEPRAKYGWTDVARFSELGIPAVNFGPGNPSKAHADDESVPVGHLHDCYEALSSWLIGA
jgi:succinyl-diaminopimelate desuccinylase